MADFCPMRHAYTMGDGRMANDCRDPRNVDDPSMGTDLHAEKCVDFAARCPVGWSDVATFKACVARRVPHCGSAPRRYCESCVCIDSTLLLAGYSPRIQKPIGVPRARQKQKITLSPPAPPCVDKSPAAFRGFAIGAGCCRVLLRLQVRRECVVSGRQGRRCAHGNAVRHSCARGKLVRTNTGAELELECTSAGQQLRVPVYSGFLVCAAAALDCPARH